MCLTVKKPVKYLVKKCYKQMKLSFAKHLVTPYQDYAPNFQGLLLPEYRSINDRNLYKGESVNSGYIHAYAYSEKDLKNNKTEITNNMLVGDRVFLKAYAFWTTALGFNDDLVCKALYVPQLDLTNRRDKRVSMLENRYNKERLINEFGLGMILGDY